MVTDASMNLSEFQKITTTKYLKNLFSEMYQIYIQIEMTQKCAYLLKKYLSIAKTLKKILDNESPMRSYNHSSEITVLMGFHDYHRISERLI